MSLPTPNLDDRDFRQLLDECTRRIRQSCPAWTDLSPSDPGMVLLELFAHLTEVMIYRLNRLPDKAYVEFLRLIGVRLASPVAAATRLRFTPSRTLAQPVEIRQGTRVTLGKPVAGQETPVFVTARTISLPPGQAEIEVLAHHGEWIEAELAGRGTGSAGLTVKLRRPPVVAPLENHFDLTVAIEAVSGELDDWAPALQYDGRPFRIWREVEDFVDLGPDPYVYVADRLSGLITFAPLLRAQDPEAPGRLQARPAALAAIPPVGREIRIWYCRGGGSAGNVAANTLTVVKDPIPGVAVTNPAPASGGLDAETLENALVRGPLELHSLHRAVTAKDFELIALRMGGAVARAKAFTTATLWKHATPGTVEVLLVPAIPDSGPSAAAVTPARIREHQTPTTLNRIKDALDHRRPLGTACFVGWVRYKTVRVRARVIVYREEDPSAVTERVRRKLCRTINPLPSGDPGSEGWRFGQSLRASHLYEIILAEPGVKYVEQVRMLVDEAPAGPAGAVVPDGFQAATWHAGRGELAFRSVNDGDGWELTASFPGETIKTIRAHPTLPGLLVLVTELAGDTAGHRVHVTRDCGESWVSIAQTTFAIDDVAWLLHLDPPAVLLATDVGLYQLALRDGAVPLQILVEPANQTLGFFAVTVTDLRGEIQVAVAARAAQGVYLSSQEGRANTFKLIGLKGTDVRVLEIEADGPRRYLWGGTATPGFAAGQGCVRMELPSADLVWTKFDAGWEGGSCLALSFSRESVYAATHHAGVVRLDATPAPDARWAVADVNGGLPMRDRQKFQRVNAVGVLPAGKLAVAAGPDGLFRSRDAGKTFVNVSGTEFVDEVTLPETWLFCSGEHELTFVTEDEAKRD